jgi:TolB-like protein/Flp pilus assembly protein TadD
MAVNEIMSSPEADRLLADPLYLTELAKLGLAPSHTQSTVPLKGSIAVLPFANLGGDAEQDYFAEGISEDILTELQRFRNLFVIARNSSFSFKDKSTSVQEIARALNVEYVVTGSVRRSGNRVRVAARLAHAGSGQEIWADRFDRELEDIFKVQDEVVRTIVVTLESRLGMALAEAAGKRETPSLAAYECVQLARSHVNVHDHVHALPLVKRALELDPSYASAHLVLSHCYYVQFLEDSAEETLEKMHAAALRAVALDETESRAHATLGMALTFKQQYDLAGTHLERALRLNPADTLASAYRAEWQVRCGHPDKALGTMEDLVQRDPISPPWHIEIRAYALLLLRRYSEALLVFTSLPYRYWYTHGNLAICHAQLGALHEAREEIQKLLLIDPDITVRKYTEIEHFRRREDRDLFAESLRLAGLPE